MKKDRIGDANSRRNLRNEFWYRLLDRIVICSLVIAGIFSSSLYGQNFLTATGVSGSTVSYPAEMGFVDASNGNLHLEIPLGSFPQRGGSAPLIPKLIYDSHIWTVIADGTSYVWAPINELFWTDFGTWQFDDGGTVGPWSVVNGENGCSIDVLLASGSGNHLFNIPGTWNGSQCSGTTGSYAVDSSGFQIRQTAWGDGVNAIDTIYAPDGTEVYGGDICQQGVATEDANGNYLGISPTQYGCLPPPGASNPTTDTLGRQVVNVPTVGNTTTLYVMNAQGGTSNYVVTTATISG